MNQNQTIHPGTGRYQEQTKDGGKERKKERKKNCKGKTAGENNRFATFCPLAHLRIMETMLEHNVLVIYSL